MNADFHNLGTQQKDKDFLNRARMGKARDGAHRTRSFGDILSGPGALDVSNYWSRLLTYLTFTTTFDIPESWDSSEAYF